MPWVLAGVPISVVVEREDCSASLWHNQAYDHLMLHLANVLCKFPHMSYPTDAPTYIPKAMFSKYFDDYMKHFNIQMKYLTSAEPSKYDNDNCWSIVARDMVEFTTINSIAKFLIVASGENIVDNIPKIPRLHIFPYEAIHSSGYKLGKIFCGKSVLVIGSGNSRTETAYDHATHGSNTFIFLTKSFYVHYIILFGNRDTIC
jgi:indole-3-pyruvate monooxygenase